MPSPVEEAAGRFLKGVIPDELLKPYLHLLGQNGCLLAELPEALGAEDAKALVKSGMAQFQEAEPDRPARLVPTPTDLVLQRTLVELARDVLMDHERLLDGHQRMRAAFPATSSSSNRSVDQLARVISDGEEVRRLTQTLMRSAQRDWLTLGSGVSREGSVGTSPAVGSEIKWRAIYGTDSVAPTTTPGGIDAIAQCGGQVRLLPRISMNMGLADEAVAVVQLTAGAAGALLIQSSVIVGALREYFELLWERAIPFGDATGSPGQLPPTQARILNLLVQGLSDDAIADRMDSSLTTVRRQVTAIRESLGARTRFELGVLAVRRGLVD
jgi:DNA-binding CsgD family transcriptional regulator